jgi:RNA polymerase sigma-70 factor (ECF subfamily)
MLRPKKIPVDSLPVNGATHGSESADAKSAALPSTETLVVVPITRNEDQEILARLRGGDERAFESLFRLQYPRLVLFAEHYLRSRDEACDIVHDVLLRVWAQRATIRVRSTLNAYLIRATRNAALDRLKHLGVEARWAASAVHEVNAELARVDSDDSENSAADATRAELLCKAIAALPPRRREVITLRWVGGMRFAEIAEVMGISVRGIEKHHERAIAALRAALRQPG